ncbi:MAG: AAA family ATPase [Buchananella hordeovulneris]|nr:AAA family ATPase [Buchananella hordeovulneris]
MPGAEPAADAALASDVAADAPLHAANAQDAADGTEVIRDAEIAREQVRVSAAYAALDERRERYRSEQARVQGEAVAGTPQSLTERDALAAHYGDEAQRLSQVEERLVFGRLDMNDGEERYVGRIGLHDAEGNKLLLDWRAPACEPFYRATAAHPLGVARRRHVVTRRRQVIDLQDDLLDTSGAVDLTQVRGEGALFGALAAARSGRMNDIVATIQAEQDVVVRAPLDGVTVVQGGPGTGKTAVALHRAAYLLHTHRERLARSGVLVVGPSRTFLRYIEHVLPSLGESGVVSTTMGDLLPGYRVGGRDSRRAAEIKGRAVWQKVLERIVSAKQRIPARQKLRVSGLTIDLEPGDVRSAITRARRTGFPHNEARVKFVECMLDSLSARLAVAYRRSADAEVEDWMREDLRQDRDVRIALNKCWMPIDIQSLLGQIFYHPHYLDTYAPELTEDEKALVWRPLGSPLTEADIPLLDELAELVGDTALERTQRAEEARRAAEVAAAQAALETAGLENGIVSAAMLAERFAETGPEMTLAERAGRDRAWTYGHVIVDEAQELSPMAWRAILRRCPAHSLTVVGDLAQCASAAPASSWQGALGKKLAAQVSEYALTVSYRTPSRIIDAATESLEVLGSPAGYPLTAARDLTDSLLFAQDVALDDLESLVRGELAWLDEHKGALAGTLAVIAPPNQVAQVRAALQVHLGQASHELDLLNRVVALGPLASKGLEFDSVVVWEPMSMSAHPADLYVAMTRPTTRLLLASQGALPAWLREMVGRLSSR